MRNLVLTIFFIFPAVSQAQTQDDIRLMQAVYAEIQLLSFENRREYCGYIGLDYDGNLIASPARRGRMNACRARDPRDIAVIYASYHTHGAFEGDEGHEVPSVGDMEADADEGIDGFVATPGGRLWYIDTTEMVTYQICGAGCLPQDPNFVPFPAGTISNRYSYDELVEWLEY